MGNFSRHFIFKSFGLERLSSRWKTSLAISGINFLIKYRSNIEKLIITINNSISRLKNSSELKQTEKC